MHHYCKNCGWQTRYPRWCDDCWRMIVKTLVSQLVIVAVGWLASRVVLNVVVSVLSFVVSAILRIL